jgi:alginate O-acetyltransferase complex protein AlgI
VLFTEPTFLFVFLPVVLLLHLAGGALFRNVWLVAASLVFYASGAGAFTTLIVASIAGNYLAALAIDSARGRRAGRLYLAAAVAANVAVLAVFKYAGFVGTNLNVALAAAGLRPVAVPDIALPIGISFFTFHAISYVVDVARGDAVAQKGPVAAALYLLFFPQLIAGPIIRYRDIAAQLATRAVGRTDLALGARRFVVGLAKKMLVANVVAGPADRIFALPVAELTAPLAWLGVVCYTVQIYFDFSGYSDMAIGLGRMFGFRFPENFRYPYTATSVQDFWRRWHLSLSTWFRDYLYLPLGGSRVSPARTYLNLVTVFALCGLWHGASWTFVVWGLFHGAFLVGERWFASAEGSRPDTRLRRALGRAGTLVVVMVGWVFFRADSLSAALGVISAMAGGGAGAPTTYAVGWYLTSEVWLALGAGVIGATPIVPALVARLTLHARGDGSTTTLGPLASAGALTALLLMLAASLMLSAAGTYSPFIYYRF